MILRVLKVSLVSLVLAGALHSQPPVQPYLDAFAEWRKLDPALEHEASTAGAQASDRVTRAYSAVTKYAVARSAHMRSMADESGQLLRWIQNSATGGEIDVAPVKMEQALIGALTDGITRDLATYAKDTDRGIVQLRVALERERIALTELNQAVDIRDKAWAKARQLLPPSEEARARALAQYQPLSTGYSAAAAESEREEPSWAGYYQALSDAITRPVPAETPAPVAVSSAGAPASGPAPSVANPASNSGGNVESTTAVTISGVRIMNPANSVAPSSPEPPPAAPPPVTSTPAPAAASAVVNPAPAPERTGPIPPLPLSRYTGEWFYPTSGGMFFGVQPETIDLKVQESNGRLQGTLIGRFKAPPGTSPEIRLTFSGDMRTTRNQIFLAETTDGARGPIELIPGTAFNLLEVNFSTEPRPGKLRLINIVVVKK